MIILMTKIENKDTDIENKEDNKKVDIDGLITKIENKEDDKKLILTD